MFNTGVFLDPLKVAKIHPKKPDTLDIDNYHPISLLLSFSQVFEKILNNRLLAFFQKHNVNMVVYEINLAKMQYVIH